MFYNSVYSFYLAIVLGVIFCRQLCIDLQVLAQVFPYIGCELSTPIGYEDFGGFMEFSDVSVERIGTFLYFYSSGGDEMSYLGETVNEDENITVRYSHKGTRR